MKIIIDDEFRSRIPRISDEELSQLEANLLADGCRDPLVVWNDLLLDGHNRYAICQKHGIKFELTAVELPNREAALDWMDANQLGRRNLTADQRSLLRGRRYNRTKKDVGRPKGKRGQNVHFIKTSESLAKEHGVNEKTIRRDGKLAEEWEKLKEVHPEEAKAVQDGKKKFKEVRRTLRLEEVKEAAALPTQTYRVIYADPPWKYGDQLTEDYGGTKFHYPSMTIQELCEMPVAELAQEDAVLFLWVTSPLLYEAAPLIPAWGFKYKACFIWDKIKHNMGHYNSVRHELLLICTRGSCVPDSKKLFDSVQSIERTGKHSQKPEEFRKIIDELYPHGQRIELFARTEANGWHRWGNQA